MERRSVLLLAMVTATLLLALSAASPPAAQAHTIYNVRLLVQKSGKCLDINGFGNQAPTHQWSCEGQAWQQWDIVATADGWHYIKNRYTGYCLDVPGQNPADGLQLWQYTCNFTDAQKFTVPACAGCWSQMSNKATGKCVDVRGGEVGDWVVIQQWPCNGTRAQQWYADNHSPEKQLWRDRWFKFFEDTGNYTTWMTLSFHRHVPSSIALTWNPDISSVRDAWNNGSIAGNTVYFLESSPSDLHDVHVNLVTADDCAWDFGVQLCLQGALGRARPFDEAKDPCPNGDCDNLHSRPNTWWYSFVIVDGDAPEHTDPPGGSRSYQRRDTLAHELGHSIVLAHESFSGGCGAVRASIMDYDCALDGDYDGPQPFDSCGINHAYYDPNWGFWGC